MVKDLELQSADVYQSTQLAILKARLFAQAGFSERGFSVAMRAASLAQKASLVPALWNAVGVICAILVNLEEYGAVVRLLDAVIPQVYSASIIRFHVRGETRLIKYRRLKAAISR